MESQKERLGLPDGRLAVDTLLEAVSSGKNRLFNPFYRSQFKGVAINFQGKQPHNAALESGFIRNQSIQVHLMSETE